MLVFPGGMASGISISDFDKLTLPRINAIFKSLNKDKTVPSTPKPEREAFSHANWQKWAEEERKKRGLTKPDGS